jgi:hypothetical protein
MQNELRNQIRNLLSTGIGVGLAAGGVASSEAATLTVTSNLDSGTGSLRDTVAAASAGDTIDFQSGLAGPITLTSGQISITQALTISGPGASALTISGNNASRIFYVHPAAQVDVTISGLTLTNGSVSTGAGGGAILSKGANLTVQDSVVQNSSVTTATSPSGGGGIFAMPSAKGASANLTLTGVTLANNTAHGGGGGAYLYSGPSGTAQVTNSLVSGNTSTNGWGGGLYMIGAASQVSQTHVVNNQTSIYPGGGIQPCGGTNFTISDSEVSDNVSASNGGGLYACFSSVTAIRTTISGNTAAGNGGGLGLYGGSAASAIQDSTISGNMATGKGGGIEVRTPQNSGGTVDYAVTLTNVTIANNIANGNGGGLYSNLGYLFGGTPGTIPLTIESSTLVGNSAATGGGVVASSKGIPIVLHNSIVANNTGAAADPDTSGTFNANFNFVFASGASTLTGANNTTAVDPQLGALGVNGGPTQTMLPMVGSPVIDAGDNTGAPSTDQRGLPRPFNATTDIGAVERQNPEDVIFRDGFGP